MLTERFFAPPGNVCVALPGAEVSPGSDRQVEGAPSGFSLMTRNDGRFIS